MAAAVDSVLVYEVMLKAPAWMPRSNAELAPYVSPLLARSSVFNNEEYLPPNNVLTTDCAVRAGSVRVAPTLPNQKYVWVASGLSTSNTRRPVARESGGIAGTGTVALRHAPSAVSSLR